MRAGLARGFSVCERCLGLPYWRSRGTKAEERLLLGLPLADKVVYDIGAHIGIFSLFFARQVGRGGTVVAFEPQPAIYRKLVRNVQVNGLQNVFAINVAVGGAPDRRAMSMLPGLPETGSLLPFRGWRFRVGSPQLVEVDSLDRLVASRSLPVPAFIKIDVEGMEAEVLEGGSETLRRWQPELLIEMHGLGGRQQKLAHAERMMGLLTGLGYRRAVHVESGAAVGLGKPESARAGHIFCASGT